MVNSQFLGGLAARAMLYAGSNLETRAETKETYATNSAGSVTTLQRWYNTSTGLWETTGWWNSGNVLTTLADFALLDGARAGGLGIGNVISNTFTQAQKSVQSAQKSISELGMVVSSYTAFPLSSRELEARASGNQGFINDFYDDEGWWALGWIRAYDVYRDVRYLNMAESIFADMQGGVDSTCGGGIWWNKSRNYKNAVTNELYLSVAASLANRAATAEKRQSYLKIANGQWEWFKNSGMINSQGLINDGLTTDCKNNGQQTWTYNQGVILGALVELHAATGVARPELLDAAQSIASAAMGALTNDRGILIEPCEPGQCGDDGAQFKGVFVRNLRTLFLASPDRTALRDFILRNADSIWTADRVGGTNELGLVWSGPPNAGGVNPTAGTHSSAMDALVAAMAVAPS